MFTPPRTAFLFVFVALASSLVPPARAGEAGAVARTLPIATDAFAGSSINVVANIRSALVTHRGVQYAAYYDAEGYVVLAQRPLGADGWTTRRTEYRGDVSDAHRSISIAVDGSDVLHIAWDHHNNPLNYVRGTAPGSLELGGKLAMTGSHEMRVTYPQFFRLPDGDLLFLYRDGESGKGSLMLNRYDVTLQKWRTVQSNLIDGEGQRSPYWSMTTDQRGSLHLAWTWRDSPDVASNHDLAYARSDDAGHSWKKADGSPLALPLTVANCDYAARVPVNSNLMNPPSIGTTKSGRPCIVDYWSPTTGAAPQFHLVRFDGKAWTVTPGPASKTPFSLAGQGTKRPPFSRAVVLRETGDQVPPQTHVIYRDDNRGSRVIAATFDESAGSWSDLELTRDSVGAWEPTFDSDQWDRMGQLHLLVENVQQVDGNDQARSAVAAAPISTIVWSPGYVRSSRQRTETPAAPISAAELEKKISRADVLALAQKSIDWQWSHMPDPAQRPPRGWETAPFYLGVLAVDRVSADHHNRDAMRRHAEALGWEPHRKIYHADDHCVTQAYLELYEQLQDPRMIAPTRKRFDDVLAHPPASTLDWNSPNHLDRWSWCDALFMAPDAWLMLSQFTGDRRYLDYMNREWWATTDKLFNPQTGFYFRDESYLDLREPNGKPIHWARGNGWVFAGLVRVLDRFPQDHPDYAKYVQLYHTMAKAVLASQQPDGMWRTGLLDPVAHTASETSGSSFLTFGLAWGINRGVLDRATIEPAVRRAWNALARCVTSEGKLEHVQPIGAAPVSFDPHNTEAFAVGAFLLAASEVSQLAQ